MMREYLQFYIDGQWVDPVTPKTLDVINPANEEVCGHISLGSAEDVDRAVQAAKAALAHPSWKLLPATDRGQLMGRLADLLEQNRELLATIDAWDNGMSCRVPSTSIINTHLKSQANPTMSHSKKTSQKPSVPSVTTADGPTRPSVKPSTLLPKSSPILFVSRSVSSLRLFHGITLSLWQLGSWDLLWLVETLLC